VTGRAWLRRHPETLVLLLSALAWLVLLSPAGLAIPGVMRMSLPTGSAVGPASPPMAGMPWMRMPIWCSTTPSHAQALCQHGTPLSNWTLPMFVLMAAAMMLPSTAGSVRDVAGRSLWRRRRRAVTEWIVGYLGVWVLTGAAILGLRTAAVQAGMLTPGPLALVVGLLAAACWQLTPAKRRALSGCHRTRPLPPRGLRADRECLRWGVTNGRDCAISCGPMMTAMTLGHGNPLLLMPGLTVVVLAERFRHRTPRRTSAAALALLAAVAA
jgi:predicted metal-binding membrane protein